MSVYPPRPTLAADDLAALDLAVRLDRRRQHRVAEQLVEDGLGLMSA